MTSLPRKFVICLLIKLFYTLFFFYKASIFPSLLTHKPMSLKIITQDLYLFQHQTNKFTCSDFHVTKLPNPVDTPLSSSCWLSQEHLAQLVPPYFLKYFHLSASMPQFLPFVLYSIAVKRTPRFCPGYFSYIHPHSLGLLIQ